MGKFLLLASQIVTQKKSLETGADQFHLSAPKSLSRERSHMSERRDVERALRRHRKRLARIVVDQWLFKARTRLLVLRLRKIVQKHWKLCCFKALKEFTASNVLKHEKQKAALNFSIIWRKRQYFKAWFTFCKLQCRQSEKTLRLSKSVRRRVCSMFLHIWLQRMQQQIEMQRKTNVAERFWMLSLLSASFMHWQLGLIIIKRKKKINKLALGYWAHKRLSSSFSTLKKAVALKCMILALTAKRDLRLVRCFFNYWHSISKEDMKELEKQAVCAVHKRLLLKSFDTLQNYTSKRNSARHLNQIAICFHHDQCMYCTYRAWRNYVILRKNTRKMAAAALTHMNRRLMRSVLIKWHSYTQSQKQEDSIDKLYEEKICVEISEKNGISEIRTSSSSNKNENKALCRLSLVVSLLQYQNKLLKRGITQITRNKRFSAKKGLRAFFVSRACFLYRKCIRELTSAAQRYINITKDKRCHVCTEHVPFKTEKLERTAHLQKTIVSSSDVAAGTSRCHNQAKSNAVSLNDMVVHDGREDEPSLSKTSFQRPDLTIEYMSPSNKFSRAQERRGALINSKARFLRRTRLPPRRPLYLSDSYIIESHALDPKMIKDELMWTESILCGFDKLKEEIRQKEAELAALNGRHASVVDAIPQSQRKRFLEEKLIILRERESIMLPIIEGLTSRAGALRRCFCKESQADHLD